MGLDIYFAKRSQNTPQTQEGDDTEISEEELSQFFAAF